MDDIKRIILDRLRGEYEWRYPLEYSLTASHGDKATEAIDELVRDGVLIVYQLHGFDALRLADEAETS